MNKLTQLAAAVALTVGAVSATPVMAEGSFSANVGFASEYHFRGIKQKDSSASAGLDYENSGFYVGTWAADVGDGLEVDAYGGWGFETESGFSAGIGATGYYYTGEFDDTYEEVNFYLGFGFASLEYSVGEYDGFGDPSDYDYLALTLEHNGFYATAATFGKDSDGEYLQLGYDTTISGIDLGIAAIFASDELSDECTSAGVDAAGDCIESDEGESIIFTIGKSFDL